MNARFWVWWGGGWVKLTLRPGQTLEASRGGRNEEGYSCESCVWSYEGEMVTRAWSEWGRDCDGPSSSGGETVCHVSRLASWYPGEGYGPPDGAGCPDWQDAGSWRRDVYAEAAGY